MKFNYVISFFAKKEDEKKECNLSPTLLNLFINGLPDIFHWSCTPVTINDTNISCLLYANDLVFLSEPQTHLQNCLAKLDNYTKKWKLDINFKKSINGAPTQNRIHSASMWSIGQSILENVNEYSYLVKK